MLITRTMAIMCLGLVLVIGASVANADMTVTSRTWFMDQSNTFADRTDLLTFAFLIPDADHAVASNFAVLSSGVAGQGNVFFAALVGGFGTEPGSHFLGGSGAVPAPGATLLGLIGLATIAWIKRYHT